MCVGGRLNDGNPTLNSQARKGVSVGRCREQGVQLKEEPLQEGFLEEVPPNTGRCEARQAELSSGWLNGSVTALGKETWGQLQRLQGMSKPVHLNPGLAQNMEGVQLGRDVIS